MSDSVKLSYVDSQMEEVGINAFELYAYWPSDPDERELFVDTGEDVEYEVRMCDAPRILTGKGALTLAKFMARELGFARLHVNDVAHVPCLADCGGIVEYISFLRIAAGGKGLYEASGATYPDPARAEQAKLRLRRTAAERIDQKTGQSLASLIRAYLRGAYNDPDICDYLSSEGEDLYVSLEDRGALTHLFWPL